VRRLVVCDSHDGRWISRAGAVNRPGDQWDILPVRISGLAFERRHRAALGQLTGAYRVLDVTALAGDAHLAVDPFVLDLVWKLPAQRVGGTTLGRLLQDRTRNLWWSLEISEKSSFRGRLLERLYQLALIDGALKRQGYGEVWLELEDRDVAAVVSRAGISAAVRVSASANESSTTSAQFIALYWMRAALTLGRFLASRLVIAFCGWSGRAETGTVGIFTLFPYWWVRPYSREAADRFFSAPPDDAHYVAWLSSAVDLWRHRAAATRTVAARRIVPLQRFISVIDALRILSAARFVRLFRAQRAAASMDGIRFGSFDVSSLVAAETRASMADSEMFFDALVERGLRSYARHLKPGLVLYRVEGQPWENALLAAVAATSTPVAGFFHSPFGPHYAALRFAPGELAGEGHGAGPRPVAPRMLVCGDTVRAYLEADGYPRERIAACGPQRHAAFLRFLAAPRNRAEWRDRLDLPQDLPVYVVAIAIVEVETEGLFACLEAALAAPSGFRLVIKTHPNRPLGDESMQAAVRSIGPGRVSYVPPDADMYEYLAAADAMICIGSTLAFEAMALGVMPIVYEHPGTLAVLSLRAFQSALYVVDSPDTMASALAEIAADAPQAAAKRTQFASTVRNVLGDIDSPLDRQLNSALACLDIRRSEFE
jgi:surface carbohydrate biosynthesis protein (TIGR04326 family)